MTSRKTAASPPTLQGALELEEGRGKARRAPAMTRKIPEKARKELVRSEARSGPLLPDIHKQRDFFLADILDVAIKDDGASMEAPIFALATKPDLTQWQWKSQDDKRGVTVIPSALGRATIWDKDILIYCISQVVEGLNRGRSDAQNEQRTVRFTVYDYLMTTGKGSRINGRGYKDFEAGLERLQGTLIRTDIATGGKRTKERFPLIEKSKIVEKSPDDHRMVAVEITFSPWVWNAIQAFEVLTLNRTYFRLRGGLERRLYELARKHCGGQASWSIGFDLLHAKSGSRATAKEFRRMLKSAIKADGLPDYRIAYDEEKELVVFYTKDIKKLAMKLLPAGPA